MLGFWVSTGLIVILAILFYMMTRVYKVNPKPHTRDPSSMGIAYDEIRFPTKNDKRLFGWWIHDVQKHKKPIVILVHGWTRNVERVLPYIEMLHNDFDLLAFDSRCHGSSDEDTYSSMPRFAEDIVSAVDYVHQNYPERSIGLLGLSMGGAAAIYAASLQKQISAVVTVGAFAHPADVMQLEFKKRYIPYFPMVWLLFEYIQFLMKERFDRIAPERNIGNSDASFLIIHGTDDSTAPIEHAKRLYTASKKDQTKLVLLEKMGHSNCHKYSGIDKVIKVFLAEQLK